MRQNIIRIEHPIDGQGLWNAREDGQRIIFNLSCYHEIKDRHNDETRFPSYWTDKELQSKINENDISNYYFAFKSLDQLEVAIDREWMSEILRNGYIVLMLDVTDYYESQYQVVFKKSSITSQKDISSLFQ